jgi:HSP20 family protein
MNMRDLIPWGRNERPMVPSTVRGEEMNPFLTLHREMNRLFDDVFSRFEGGMPSLLGRIPSWPSIEATETDKDVRISAELPGMDEKDVEVLVDEDVLTIRGEKKAESEDKERRFSERYYGRFERRVPLGQDVDEDKVEAAFKNGVLTITVPRTAQAASQAKRIAINSGETTKH